MSLSLGTFVAIVGPSGAGKDSLIRALGERMRGSDAIVLARRFVTRASDTHEDHETLDEATFLRLQSEGRFALWWSAHGLHYGVPIEIDAAISAGKTVVCNVSRASIAALRARYQRSFVIAVTARPETLAARLAARGRESGEARQGRLERGRSPEIAIVPDRIVDNDGPLEVAAARLWEIVASCVADARANPETRYALYLAPPPESELWRFGCEVIGRDAASGDTIARFTLEGYDADAWRALTSEPRRYGFHATLKAPFRLAPSVRPCELEARVSSLARFLRPFAVEELRVTSLAARAGRAFVALTPADPSDELARLEAVVVRELDDLRASLTAAERARRMPERLSARQRANLDAWGYPYVLEEFRLHLTLTNAIADHERIASALSAEFGRHVVSHRLEVDALALFIEEAAGEPFRVLRRFPFGAGAAS